MRIKPVKKGGRRTKRTSSRPIKLPKRLRTFDDGYRFGDELVRKWNSQPNPPKVYFKGYRIHHGLGGLGLAALGLLLDSKPAVGLGTRLMIDDIADHRDWFKFEK